MASNQSFVVIYVTNQRNEPLYDEIISQLTEDSRHRLHQDETRTLSKAASSKEVKAMGEKSYTATAYIHLRFYDNNYLHYY